MLAKSTTTREFEDLMKWFVPRAKLSTMMLSGKPARFSWDNNSIFKSASLEVMGLQPWEKLPLSEYSPDMHKPIEHAFAQLKHSMQQKLLQPRSQPLTAKEAQQLMEECFRAISVNGIWKDVQSLPVTYHVIAGDKGVVSQGPDGCHHVCSGGDWPAKQYR